jgi:hypothetical protein
MDTECVTHKDPEYKCRMYEASLYAHRNSSAQPYSYTIFVWKQENGPEKPRQPYLNRAEFTAEAADNTIDTVDLVNVPGLHRVALLWRETAANNGANGLHSWIGLAWSNITNPKQSNADTSWYRAPTNIGPCSNTTNAVVYEDAIYVGCVADTGYKLHEGTKEGDLDLWRIRLDTGSSEYVSTAPIHGDAPRLAVRPGGVFAAAAASTEGESTVHVEISFHELGGGWSDVKDIGDILHAESQKVRYARVTALAYADRSSTVYLIYMERQKIDNALPGGLAAEFTKQLAVVAESGKFLDSADLQIENPATRAAYPAPVEGLDDGIFDDLHDDIIVWRDPKAPDDPTKERIFTAFGSYGMVGYAEIIESGDFPGPPVIVNPPPPPAPVADPNTTSQGAQAVAGAMAGVLAMSAVARMLLARRKRTVEAPTFGGK